MAINNFMTNRSLLRALSREVQIFPARGKSGRWTKAIIRVEEFDIHTSSGTRYRRYEGVAKLDPSDYLGPTMLIKYNNITYAIDETKTNAVENAVDMVVLYIYSEQEPIAASANYRARNP